MVVVEMVVVEMVVGGTCCRICVMDVVVMVKYGHRGVRVCIFS